MAAQSTSDPGPQAPEGHRPEKVAPQQVIQQGGVNLHPGINCRHRGGLQVQEARGGEPHQDPLAGEIRRRVDGGLTVLAARLRGDDVGGGKSLMAAAGAAKLEEELPLVVQGNGQVPHLQGAGSEPQRARGPEAVKRREPQGGEPLILKGRHQAHPAVDAVRVRAGLHVPQGAGRGQERRDGGDHGPIGRLVPGRRAGDGEAGLLEQVRFRRVGRLGLPGQEKRQRHVAGRGRGPGELLIVFGAVGRGLGEQDVENHRLGAGPPAIVDEGGVDLPGPGPGNPLSLEKIQVGLIHRHHHHLGRGGRQRHPAEEHVQGLEAVGLDGPGEIQDQGQRQGRQGKPQGGQPFGVPESGGKTEIAFHSPLENR